MPETKMGGAPAPTLAPDPTSNVLNLVDAAIRRQDDLRKSDHDHMRETVRMQADFEETMRNTVQKYQEKLDNAESKRIDAIRMVDVSAVAAAATVQETRAGTLAGQVAQSADAMRVTVAATAQAAQEGLTRALDPIQKDIAELRKAQYEAMGQKAQVIETRGAAEDMRPLVDAIALLTKAQSEGQGQKTQVAEHRASTGQWIALAAVGASIFGGLLVAMVTMLLGG